MIGDGSEAYPLHWPPGKRRAGYRQRSRFETSMEDATTALRREVIRLGGRDMILSTNVPLRRDGAPYARPGTIFDPGAAVYFSYKGDPMCFACDKWDRVNDNVWAIVKTIEALRGIERWGSGDMVAQAFAGFVALPNPEQWWHVLGLDSASVTIEEIEAAYRRAAMTAHPDRGGSDQAMSRINWARDKGIETMTR